MTSHENEESPSLKAWKLLVTFLANYLRQLQVFLSPTGCCERRTANFSGLAAASSELTKADTPEPLRSILTREWFL